MKITKSTAYAVGQDAGNRNMKKNGRIRWNEEDWNAAAKITNNLLDKMDGVFKRSFQTEVSNERAVEL